jgi:SAM-dependent methyltransferase
VGRQFEPVWAHVYDTEMNGIGSRVTSAHYFNEVGNQYFEWQDRFGSRSGQINARKFKDFILDSDFVLDFGCGGGFLLDSLVAKKKMGIEINPIAVNSAKQKGIEVYSDLSSVKDNSVDKVISNHALEHVSHPIFELSEIRRVLRPGGKLILCVPIDDYRRQRKFKESEINNHLQTWTPQLIGNCLVEAGFQYEKINVRILIHSWFPGTKYLWKREQLFNLLCTLWAIVRFNGRQILCVATKDSQVEGVSQ